MRGKWLPCPFCGKELVEFGRGMRNGKVVEQRIHPQSRSCPLGFGIVIDKKRWQRRAKHGEGKVPSHNTGSPKLPPCEKCLAAKFCYAYVKPDSHMCYEAWRQLRAGT